MREFSRMLETYMPFVIIGSMWNMLPDLVNALAGSEKGSIRETKMGETTEEQTGSPGEELVTGDDCATTQAK